MNSEAGMEKLIAIMARLREPESGCPWDLEQDFASIAPYTIEEAYEVADAIERNNMEDLLGELGDLLLQVVYHSQMAKEEGHFTVNEVIEAICQKMVQRHPHVFGDKDVASAQAQTIAWESHKEAERGSGALDGVAKGLPALLRTAKLQARAARVGFDWPKAAGALEKLREELDELAAEMEQSPQTDITRQKLEDELGDVLFSAVNLARKLELDPEAALRRGNAKFEARFRQMEAGLAARGKTPKEAGLEEMEALWQKAKEQR